MKEERRNLKRKSEQKIKWQKIEHLKKLTKVSSTTTLAANNHYTLDATVLEMVVEKHLEEEAAQKAIQDRKNVVELKCAELLKKAVEKISVCPNGLSIPDLKLLVVAAIKASELPVKSKKSDLQEQLYHEPQYSRVQAIANVF